MARWWLARSNFRLSTLSLVCFLVESTPLTGTKMTPRNEVSRMICSFYSCGCPLVAYVICLKQVCFFIRVYKYIHIYCTYLPYYAFYTSAFLHQITSISFSTQVIMQFPSLPESRVQSPSYSLCLYRHSHQNTHKHTHTHIRKNTFYVWFTVSIL